MSQPLSILVQGVSVTYEQWDVRVSALENASFAFDGPGWILITGANGSGKSTLLSVLAGALQPAKGTVEVAGTDILSLSPAKRAAIVSIARQRSEDGLVIGLTVGEHASLCGFKWVDFLAAVRRLELGQHFEFIERVSGQQIEGLSGGQRQIVSLLLQLLRPTPLLLLDEPLAALDPDKSIAFISLLRRLSTEKMIVQITHEPETLRPYADMEIRLRGGVASVAQLRSDGA